MNKKFQTKAKQEIDMLPSLPALPSLLILCKVIDNFGDAGFVTRLAKRILALSPNTSISIITDDSAIFIRLWPTILEKIAMLEWKAAPQPPILQSIRQNALASPLHIIETFECGRPDWLDAILFPKTNPSPKAQIIMVDYLTAESYAQEFHLKKSLTRSSNAQKILFMPGFSKETGGVLLDTPPKSPLLPKNATAKKITVLVFTYPKNIAPLVAALSRHATTQCIQVKLANGAGAAPFIDEYTVQKSVFALENLPFLPQNQWDALFQDADVLIVRGEDSWSRACLAGKPFLWQAYSQDGYEAVKVEAFLARMERHFPPAIFSVVKNAFLCLNATAPDENEAEKAILLFLQAAPKLSCYYRDFSKSIYENGDLTAHLLQAFQNFPVAK